MRRPDIVDPSPRELVQRAGNLTAAEAAKLARRSPVRVRRVFAKYESSKRVSASVVRAILIVFGIACGVPTLFQGQEQERPVRVVVTPEHSSVQPGKATVKIALKDLQNHDVHASKDFTITLTVIEATATRESPPRPSPTTQVTIPQGKDSAKIDLALPTTGIYLIKATHPALRDGADFIQVRAPTSVQRAPTATKRFKQRSSAIPNSLFASLEWSGLSLKALPDVPRPPLELIVVTTHQGAKVIPEEPVLVRAFLSEEAP